AQAGGTWGEVREGTAEAGDVEGGALELRAREIDVLQVRPGEVGVVEDGWIAAGVVGQRGPGQACALETRVCGDLPEEREATQVGTLEAAVVEADSRQISPGLERGAVQRDLL